MKLLIDQNVPFSLADGLREAGHDADHTRERGLMQAKDFDLISLARDEGRVVITYDGDFAQLIALSGSHRPSVVHRRLGNLPVAYVRAVLIRVLAETESALDAGAIVSRYNAKTPREWGAPVGPTPCFAPLRLCVILNPLRPTGGGGPFDLRRGSDSTFGHAEEVPGLRQSYKRVRRKPRACGECPRPAASVQRRAANVRRARQPYKALGRPLSVRLRDGRAASLPLTLRPCHALSRSPRP